MNQLWSFQIGGWLRHGGKVDVDVSALRGALSVYPDCEITLTVEPAGAKRSSAANRYLWGPVYTVIMEYTGQSKEDIHDEMCARFTTEMVSYVNPKTGELVETEVVRRTSNMSVARFHRFIDSVKLFWGEFGGLTFPEPGEDYVRERERAEKREKGRAA